MKKVISGVCCMISGTLLNITFLIITFLSIDQSKPYFDKYGHFWQTAIDDNFMPFIIVSSVLLVLGLAFVIWGIFDKNS